MLDKFIADGHEDDTENGFPNGDKTWVNEFLDATSDGYADSFLDDLLENQGACSATTFSIRDYSCVSTGSLMSSLKACEMKY